MNAGVQIGKVKVGGGEPCALMAEIGTFFNKDIGLAKDYLARIVEAGVPLFKTEILHDADVCLRSSGLQIKFQHAAGAQVEEYRRLIERKTVPLTDYEALFAAAREAGIPFVASVYDFEGVDFFVKQGGAALKIARHNITHLPLIRYCAATGLPVIFDAGIVYLHELATAVHAARTHGNGGVVVNHHPGPNPTAAEGQNLRAIATYKEIFNTPVGLACHYRGDEILYTAIGLGADLLEKGVVDDPNRVEQDVVSAARLSELPELARKVRACAAALGKRLPPIKEPRDLSTRKGLVARAALRAGTKLTLENVGFAWPPLGIAAEYWDLVEKRAAARDLKKGKPIRWEDVGG
ncbi:MAG: N-acetylneuraminate synthase family protein [Chthoniobacteraceae bacterium]|jgi:sialic acid synthase SpsE